MNNALQDENVAAGAEVAHDAMANAIRALSMDAVERANSGHPGMPMGMADVATVLFSRFLKFDASRPNWPDRDRFVLSAGHGSMLLYSLLHLTGYKDMTLEELKNFRQLGAKTCGHPEYGEAAGIETTTGPLGQGLGNAVGMALAEQLLAARYGKELVDHYTYVIAGDGCLMEGISHEAISLAGHLRLGKLIVLFDDNHISIDGPTELSVSDDQPARFAASGWDVQAIDGHDPEAIAAAIAAAQQSDQPSLIACRTTIGKGAPNKAGTAGSHGAPLGEEEIAGAREALNWPYAPFEIPQDILQAWRAVGARGAEAREAWEGRIVAMHNQACTDTECTDPFETVHHMALEFERTQAGELPAGLDKAIAELKQAIAANPVKEATRKSSGNTLEKLAGVVPELIGGSADLTGSNNTKTPDLAPVTADDFSGRYIYYGVREHAMCAAMNGIALHKGLIPYGGTFFVFTDYCRPSIRLAALMHQRAVYVMTHDSIGLGEDGPTHQPVEHLASLRAMPNLHLFRPCDAVETAECWQLALHRQDGPSMLALTRQGLQPQRTEYVEENLCAKGGYILAEAEGDVQATLFASGSEVEIAMDARATLQQEGVGTRVISMVCTTLFDQQDKNYITNIVCNNSVKIAIEAASPYGWEKYIGPHGSFIGMRSFGASAPADDLYKHFGITAEAVVTKVREKLAT